MLNRKEINMKPIDKRYRNLSYKGMTMGGGGAQ